MITSTQPSTSALDSRDMPAAATVPDGGAAKGGTVPEGGAVPAGTSTGLSPDADAAVTEADADGTNPALPGAPCVPVAGASGRAAAVRDDSVSRFSRCRS